MTTHTRLLLMSYTTMAAMIVAIAIAGWLIAIAARESVAVFDSGVAANLDPGEVWHLLEWLVPIVAAGSILLISLVRAAAGPKKRFAEDTPRSQQRLESILKSTVDSIIAIDETGTIKLFNRAAELVFGWTAEEVIGRNVSILMPDPHRSRHDEYLAAYLGTGVPAFLGKLQEVPGRRKDGSTVPIEIAVSECEHEDEWRFTAVLRDITQRQQAQQEIRQLAYYDRLTGLPNRRHFQDRLEEALKAAQQDANSLAVLVIDIDRFKHVNDTLGHSLGDRLLGAAAERLMETLRLRDYVARTSGASHEADEFSTELARVGGNEFSVIVSELSQPMDAAKIAKRVRDLFSTPILLDGRELYVTVSIGIAVFPSDGKDAETLLRCAGAANHHAKRSGGDGFRFYSEQMNLERSRRLFLEGRLRGALARKDFSLRFQPIRDAKGQGVVAAEVLLRWNDSQAGQVSPEEFVPILEETGLIVQVGEWVLENGCATGQAWKLAGYGSVRISVNVSGIQIMNSAIVDTVRRILKKTGLSPRDLELELTESTMMQSDEATDRVFRKLKEMGVGIALDDFGTGCSSLSLLRHVPIERIKIDRSFVKNLSVSGDDRALTSAIIGMAHSLRLKVVAEGVEGEQQQQFLYDHGCDELQGFALGRPVVAEEFARILESVEPAKEDTALGDRVA